MLRTVTLAAAVLFSAPALASTCAPVDPLDKRGPSVWIVGNVTKVVTRDETLGTYMGAASVSSGLGGGRRSGSNTATITVDRVLKGNVGKQIEISSDLQDGMNLGFSFREGPIVIAAYRAKNGMLVASGCALVATGQGATAIKWDAPETVSDINGTRRNPLVILSNLAKKVSDVGDPLAPRGLEPDKVKTLDDLLASAGDNERRVGMWETITKSSPTPGNRARLAMAYVDAARLTEAKSEAERALSEGASEAAVPLNTAKLLMGEKADPSHANLKGERFQALDISGTNLKGRDLTRLQAMKVSGSGANLSGTDLSYTWFREGTLEGADLSKSNMTRAMVGASLKGANLRDTVLDLSQIEGKNGGPDLTNSRGEGNHFRGDLSGAVFDGVKFKTTQFKYVNLDGASFNGANLENVYFERATLRGVDLSKARIGKADWKEITYDCATKFPEGIDPVSKGFRNNEACAGQPEPDLSKTQLTDCDDACLRWLVAKPGRTVSIKSFGDWAYSMGASFPGKDQCPDKALEAAQPPSVRKGAYYNELLEKGFCPVVRLPGANPPDRFFSGIDPWNQQSIDRDMSQLLFLDYVTVREIVTPRLADYVRGATPQRFHVLLRAFFNYRPNSHLLSDLVIEALSTPRPSSTPIAGVEGANNEATAIKLIANGAARDEVVSKRIMDAVRANPALAERPGFMFFEEARKGAKPSQVGPRGAN